MRLCLVLVFAAVARAESADPDALLARIKARVIETTTRLPNYLCTETIDRTQYEPHRRLPPNSCESLVNVAGWTRHRTTSDRLRLDVAAGSNTEMYSWVGENRFDDRSLVDLVRSGPVSTGSFASFLTSIFGGNSATFSFKGEKSLEGRKVLEFSFEVPLERSQYRVRSPGGNWTVAAYGGEFYADAESFDLVRLVIRTRGLRPESGACQDVTTLDYARVRLNNADFLLPSQALLQVTYAGGIQTENRTVFSACHEFRGESKLTFDPAPEPEPAGTTKALVDRAVILPPDVPFTVAFAEDVVLPAAAAGDRVPCRILTAIRDASSQMLVPADTPLACRLLRVQMYDQPPPALVLEFEMTDLSVRGLPVRLAAVVETQGRLRGGISSGLLNIHRAREQANVAVLQFTSLPRDRTIKSGFRTSWITVAPR
jgi:hypothetical protein